MLEQNVILDTINAYLNVLRDQKFVELSNNNVAVLERQFIEIRDRFQLGEVTRTDVSQAESALAAAKANLTAKVGSLKISSELFLSLLGIKPYKLMNIKKNFKLPSSLEIAKQKSLKTHTKIKALKLKNKLLELELTLLKVKITFN